jgi:phosphoribosylaminoimidazole (AIR) synthetase
MAVVVAQDDAQRAMDLLRAHGEDAWIAGRIEAGERRVVLAG